MRGKITVFILFVSFLAVAQEKKPSSYVDPFIGTGGHGHTYPGATLPFGAVQLSPDTDTEGWDWCSGYHYSDNSIMGFSHTHLSGTGCGDLLDFLVVPRTGDVRLEAGDRRGDVQFDRFGCTGGISSFVLGLHLDRIGSIGRERDGWFPGVAIQRDALTFNA